MVLKGEELDSWLLALITKWNLQAQKQRTSKYQLLGSNKKGRLLRLGPVDGLPAGICLSLVGPLVWLDLLLAVLILGTIILGFPRLTSQLQTWSEPCRCLLPGYASFGEKDPFGKPVRHCLGRRDQSHWQSVRNEPERGCVGGSSKGRVSHPVGLPFGKDLFLFRHPLLPACSLCL